MSATPETDDSADDGDEEAVEAVTTNIEETGVDPDGVFDDVETSSSGDDVSSIFDDVEEGESESSSSGSGKSQSSGLATSINEGFARAAVIGLPDEWETDSGETASKDDLETELKETFETFRLGDYGAECAQRYLLVDDEDIHPAFGLLGASLICLTIVIWRRPDGDEMVDKAKLKLSSADLPDVGPLADVGSETDAATEDDT